MKQCESSTLIDHRHYQQRNRQLFCMGMVTFAFLLIVIDHSATTPVPATADDVEPMGPTVDIHEDDKSGAEDEIQMGDMTESEHGTEKHSLDFFRLIFDGGWLMVPIAFLSLFVVMIGFDRGMALRRYRMIPGSLVDELGALGKSSEGFDPRKAYRVCQKYPSAASSVVRAMLLKVGRPQSEVEHTVKEVSEREAERIYANVRWLNLAAAVAPLIGLLGTVWGMILAFFETTQLAPGQNKADFLAHGIYIALVTTLGGLSVAIPAAILSHYFEGRIQSVFHQIDELLFNLLPQIERYEGRLRVSQHRLDDEKTRWMTPTSKTEE